MPTSLADLLAPLNRDQMRDLLFSILQEPGKALPVTDWAPGSFGRQTVEMEAAALANLIGETLPEIIGGGFVDLADENWIGLKAKQDYNLDQIAATFTVQTVRLTCALAAGPYTIAIGDLWVQANSGNRYVNIEGGTLLSGSDLPLRFSAESPGSSFVDSSGTIRKLITALAGVTVDNPASDFSVPIQGTSGTGTITPSRTFIGTTPTPNSFLIRIDASGVIGGGAWSYSINGGVSWTAGGTLPSTFALPGSVTITLANGAGTPAFVVGDLYSFSTPGSAIVTQGRDQETRDELAARCKARWPSLSDVPTRDKIISWALTAAGAAVNRVRIKASASVAGQVDVYLAGPTGAVVLATITVVRNYILARLGIGEKVSVSSTSDVTIAMTGTVSVSAASLIASQQAAQNAWNSYLAASSIGDLVKVARLEQILMDAMSGDGNANLSAIALTGGTPDVQLAAGQVAVPATGGGDIAHALSWVPVT